MIDKLRLNGIFKFGGFRVGVAVGEEPPKDHEKTLIMERDQLLDRLREIDKEIGHQSDP